ncbi:MAG TPA: copper resistance system multicopper oxidase [Gammaproteobacteria bacterium]|nr:copper resistance system multicopper oxidase [Gammaproteobacteria bacterium]
MNDKRIIAPTGASGLSRRQFVKGLAVGGVVAGLGLWKKSAWALADAHAGACYAAATGRVPVEDNYHLVLEPGAVNFTGRTAVATTINGSVPGPVLHWREGDTVTLRVTNNLPDRSSMHWHGILVPNSMDGVPGVTYAGIEPGKTFVYRFPVKQSGTYWYHSHSKFQEQTGLTGPLIIKPREPEPFKYDRDYVVMLNDWTDEDPSVVFANLKKMSDYYNYNQRTVGDFFDDIRKHGLEAAIQDRLAWGKMRMSPRDISDVTGFAYTFLINGQPPNGNWTGLFKPGERVRLRFINGSSMTYFDVRIPGLKMTVVAADGNNVKPVSVDEFRIAVSETYDVLVEPEKGAYTIFAEAMDRSGYARATLATQAGMEAPVPPMDPRFERTMLDMGMGHMNMPGMAQGNMNTRGSRGNRTEMGDMQMLGGMKMHEKKKGSHDMSGMKGMAGMPGMSNMNMPETKQTTKMSGMHGFSPVSGQPHQLANMPNTAWPQPGDVHLALGPEVAHIAPNPTERLDKPGDGLNHNGRRVLTYADLVRLDNGPQNAPFYPDHYDAEVVLHCTGNMERYVFGFNGKTYEQSQPVRFPHGQRIRVMLINDTMMEHPIHLHGLWSELDNGHGRLRPLKFTISVKPGEKLYYFVQADALGRWAYHCHLLYHMEAGMFTTAIVA